jgi:hypothetical protein
LQGIAVGLFAWMFLLAMTVFWFGVFPRTGLGWLLFLLVGPILTALGEVLVETLSEALSRTPGVRALNDWVEKRTAAQSFSLLRIAYAAAWTLILVAFCVVGYLALNARFGGICTTVKAFMGRHFAG